jgi:hypothetical protein
MSISILILLLVAALVILLIVGVLVQIRVEAKEEGADMIKRVYVYLVLFATLMMTIGGGVAAFIAVADMLAPAPPYHQTFEDFVKGMERPYNDEFPRETRFSEKELREKYDTMLLEQRESQVAKAKNSLVKSLGWIIIPLPVFICFQRRLAGNGSGNREAGSPGSF